VSDFDLIQTHQVNTLREDNHDLRNELLRVNDLFKQYIKATIYTAEPHHPTLIKKIRAHMTEFGETMPEAKIDGTQQLERTYGKANEPK
jgi:hypothetical protein